MTIDRADGYRAMWRGLHYQLKECMRLYPLTLELECYF